MHAFLLIGADQQEVLSQSLNLAKKLKAKILPFPLAKIEDVRALKSFTALTVSEPTVIYIDSIEKGTEEAQNAFLKNLEEPQPNLFYVLTAVNPASVLPTILSRCEVIRLTDNTKASIKKVKLKPTLSDIDKIKDRGEAKAFVQNLINILHSDLLENPENPTKTANNLKVSLKALQNLEANGNVGLQLANLVINLTL